MRGLNFGIAPILPERFKGDVGGNSRPNFVHLDACEIGGRMCEMSESRLPVQPRIKSLMLLTGRRLGNQRSSVKKYNSTLVVLRRTSGGWKSARIAK